MATILQLIIFALFRDLAKSYPPPPQSLLFMGHPRNKRANVSKLLAVCHYFKQYSL